MAGYEYDPESLGARCSECILKRVRVGGPVAPEIHHGAQAVVIAETPGEKECELGRPLVGPGGMEFTESIQSIGVGRRSLTILQALPCQPPENDLDKVLHKLQRENKKRIERGEEPLPHPVDACRPRLMAELDQDKNIITLGKMAFKAVTGSNASVLEIRGGPVEGRFTQMGDFEFRPAQMLSGGQTADPNFPVKIMPTLHPGFVIRAKRWKASFKGDLARAFRFFKDQLNWVEPWMVFNPDPATLKEWLWKYDTYAYDTETTVEDSTVAKLKCISIATEEGGVAIAFYSIETGTAFYSDADLHQIKEILTEWFTDPNIMKVAHNHFGFDIQIIKNHFKVTPSPVIDTIMLHRLVASELPHRLGFVGSIYTDVSSWKAAHTAKTAASDNELLTYAVLDVAVTSRILMPMLDEIRLRGQSHLISKDHKIAEMCAGMKEMGMWVDMSRRKKEAIRVQAEILKYRDLAIAAAGKSVNLNSVYQLRSLLFDEWNIEPSDYTKMGDPSTSDDAMRLMRTQNRDNKQLVAFIDSLRKYRRAAKEYGTYIARSVPYGQNVGQIELPEIYDETSNEEPEDPRGLIMPDGRMHPNYNAFGTACVTPDTWVISDKGLTRIDEIPGFGPVGTAIECNDLRLHNGDELNDVALKVHPVPTDCRKITTVLGFTLTAPYHHRVHVPKEPKFLRQDRYGKYHLIDQEPTWRRFDELKIGDIIRIPIGMDCWSTAVAELPKFEKRVKNTNAVEINLPDTVSEDLAYFAGLYNADGSMHDANSSFAIRISGKREKPGTDQTLKTLKGLFGEESVRQDDRAINITSISLGDWCGALGFGRGGESKNCPRWVRESPKNIVLAYVKGLSRDSSMSLHGETTPRWRFVNYKNLCEELQMIFLNLGIPASLRYIGTEKSPNSWEVMVQGVDEVDAVCAITGQTPPVGREKLSEARKFIRRGNNLWVRITDIDEVDVCELRDVTIPVTESFWSNGFVSHNTGRLSSSNPNSQNYPKHLRGMVRAQPGRVYVGADADQLELRIITAIAQIPIYLEAFAKDEDPHSHTAAMMFKEAFTKLEKKSKQWKELRTLAKGIKYASFYGSGDETVHGIVTSAEDDKGELIYPNLSVADIAKIRRNWLKSIPQLPKWWDDCLNEYRTNGFVLDPVWGRRRDFLDGEKFNEIVNFPAQCVPGWSTIPTKNGSVPIRDLVGTRFTTWTGHCWAEATAIPKGLARLIRVNFSDGSSFVCDKTHSGRINLHGDPTWIKLSESVGQTIWIDRRTIEHQVDGSRDWVQVSIDSIDDTGVDEMVYTLSVDHPDHQYVAEGIISKNSAGAHIIHDSTFDLLDAIPFGKWGHGTGLINQCHDAVVFEVPMDHEEFRPLDAKGVPDESQREFKWCPPNCTCTANKVARLIKEAMNRSIPGLDGVTFSATPEIGLYWNEV